MLTGKSPSSAQSSGCIVLPGCWSRAATLCGLPVSPEFTSLEPGPCMCRETRLAHAPEHSGIGTSQHDELHLPIRHGGPGHTLPIIRAGDDLAVELQPGTLFWRRGGCCKHRWGVTAFRSATAAAPSPQFCKEWRGGKGYVSRNEAASLSGMFNPACDSIRSRLCGHRTLTGDISPLHMELTIQ